MKVTDTKSIDPICPHCSKERTEVFRRSVDKKLMSLENAYVFFCPHCRKVLGVGQQLK